MTTGLVRLRTPLEEKLWKAQVMGTPTLFTGREAQAELDFDATALGADWEDWMIKLTPGDQGFITSYIDPDKYEFSGLEWDDLGELANYNVITPEGQTFTMQEWEAPPEITAVPEQVTEGESLAEQELIEKQENIVSWMQEIFPESYGKWEPEEVLENLGTWVEDNPEDFVSWIRERGRTPASEGILRTLVPEITGEDLAGVFGELVIPEEGLEIPFEVPITEPGVEVPLITGATTMAMEDVVKYLPEELVTAGEPTAEQEKITELLSAFRPTEEKTILLKPDYSMWLEGERIGTYNPQTAQVEPYEPSWWEGVTQAKGLDKALAFIHPAFEAIDKPWEMMVTYLGATMTGREADYFKKLSEYAKEKKDFWGYAGAFSTDIQEFSKQYRKTQPGYVQAFENVVDWLHPIYLLAGGVSVGAIGAKLAGIAAGGGVIGAAAGAASTALIPLAAAEAAAGAGLRYAISIPLKYFTVTARTATKVALEKALNTGLDKWLVRQGIRGNQANRVVNYFLARNKAWLYRVAQDNLKKKLAQKFATRNGAVMAAAEDTLIQAEPLLLQASKDASLVAATAGLSPEVSRALVYIGKNVGKEGMVVADAAALSRLIPSTMKPLVKTDSLMTQLFDMGYPAKEVEAMSAEEAWANLFKEYSPAISPEVAKPKFEELPLSEKTRIHTEADKIAGLEIRKLPEYQELAKKDAIWHKEHPGVLATSPYGNQMIDLYNQRFDVEVNKIMGKVPPVTPEVAIPKAEAGMLEAGLQAKFTPEGEIVTERFTPSGKGVVTQMGMEDFAKLEAARAEAGVEYAGREVVEMQAELEGLQGWLTTEPAAKLVNLIKKTGWTKGEVGDLTIKQYKTLTGKSEIKPNILTKDGKHVRWEYALDELATEMGYASDEALKTAIEKAGKGLNRIKELKRQLAIAEPVEVVKARDILKPEEIPSLLTPQQVDSVLKLFGQTLAGPGTESQRIASMELRKHVLAGRVKNLQARVEELFIEGKSPEEAIKQAETETMSGKLPDLTTDFYDDVTDQIREALFAKVYQTLKDEPFELMSTVEALTNALRGESIPRIPGVKGGSAYTRLMRVFGEQPAIMKAIDQKKPIKEVVDKLFLATGAVPLDMATMEYMRSLPTVPFGQPEMLEKLFELPAIADIRTAAEKEFAKRKLELDKVLAEKKITKDMYDLELTIEWEKVNPLPPVPPYEPPIQTAMEQPSMIPPKHRHLMVRALKELGLAVTDIGNFMRANMASFDFSFWRQQAPLIVNNSGEFFSANIEAWKALWSQKAAEASWERITQDPLYQIYEEAGYDFLRPLDLPKGTAQWKGVEEFGYLTGERAIQRFTAKIPYVKVSQRAFVTGANEHNWRIFHKYYNAMLKVNERIASGAVKLKPGEAFSISANMKDFARMLGDMSGRAALGRLGGMAPAANAMFFSMRLNLGRLLTPRHLISGNPYVRKEAWKNLLTFVGVIGGVMLLGEALDLWSIEKNPRSTNFMKVRIGNTRVDPWGGFQQFVVFFSRIISKTGLVSSTDMKYNVDPLSALTKFIRGKASPLAGVISDFWTGKTFLGDKVDIKNPDQWLDRVVPFALRDIYDAWADKSLMGALIALPALLGANVQTYSGDWVVNWKKLGLPKNTDNLPYGLKKPLYTTEDFWADTAGEFRGVDPGELTSQKGFPDSIRAIAEAMQIIDSMNQLRNKTLASMGDEYVEYYARGEITQREYVLLNEYYDLPKADQAQFLIDYPELAVNPRQEWLKSHPKENAKLAVWGKVKILTLEAYNETKSLFKELDIPDSAMPEMTLPPEGSVEDYFTYQDAGDKWGYNSNEARLIIANNDELREWLGREAIDTPIPALEIKVKYAELFDQYDAYSDKDSTFYLPESDDREAARLKLKEDNPEFADDWNRMEAYEMGFADIEGYVDYYNLTVKGFRQERYRLENPEFSTAMEDLKGLVPFDADYRVPDVQYDDIYDKYQELFDAYEDADAAGKEEIRLENPEFNEARRRREAYGDFIPEELVQDYVDYYLLGLTGNARKWWLSQHKDFYDYMVLIERWKPESTTGGTTGTGGGLTSLYKI